MKRLLKWFGIVLAVPVALFLVLAGLLYVPAVQDFAVRHAAAYASEQTGLDISLSRLRLRFPLDVELSGLLVRDATGDTLVAARTALVDLDFSHVFHQRLGLDAVSLAEVQLYTKDWIAGTVIRGQLASFTLKDDVDLRGERVVLRDVEASGLDLDIALRDTTTEKDTSTTVIPWLIDIERAEVRDARVRFATVGDSLSVRTAVGLLSATQGRVDLLHQRYTVGHALLEADTLSVHLSPTAEPLALGALSLSADSIDFNGGPGHLALPAIGLRTAASRLQAAVDMDFRALEAGQGGGLNVSVQTDLSRRDFLGVAGTWLPKNFAQFYPDRPLHLRLTAEGNMDALALRRLEASLPGSLYLDAQGDLQDLLDSTGLAASVDFNVETKDLSWVRSMAGGALDGISLPPMHLGGTAKADGSRYGMDAILRAASGMVALKGNVDTHGALAYEVRTKMSHLNVRQFLPRDSIGHVSLTAKVEGRGTDLIARQTRLLADAEVSQLEFGHWNLTGLGAAVRIGEGRGHLTAHSDNELLTATADIDALLAKRTDLTFGLDLSRADLQALGLTKEPMKTSMCLHLDGSTDLARRHEVAGTVSDIVLLSADSLFRLTDIDLEAILHPDTTHLRLVSGDLFVSANGRTGYDRLLEQLDHFTAELNRQKEERKIDSEALAKRLPQIDLHIRSGQNNPVHNSIDMLGYDYESVRLDLNLDPMVGINGGGHIHRLNTGAVLLDTITWHTYQDSTGVKMDARVHNGRRHPQFSFDARLNAYLLPSGAGANLIYLDERGRKGVDMGLVATVEEAGLRVHLDPLDPIIAYRTFHLNDSNYVLLGHKNRVEANIDLLADDGTGLQLYSTPNEEALQDLSLSVNRLNLGELMSVMPYAPRLTGFLHGDAHLIQTEEHLSVSTDLTADDLTYEKAAIGQLGLQAVYLPNADGSHFVDGSLLQTGMPVVTFTGTYAPEGNGLDIDAQLERLPFSLADGFIPNGMARLEGVAIGQLHVSGSTEHPLVDGLIATSGLRVISDMYSLNLRFEDDSIRVAASDLQLDRINVFSVGENPFVIDGSVNFADLDKIRVDATMAATNFQLINAKRTSKSLAYGKVYVDFSAMLRGTLDNLQVFGRLKMLGDTDVTYVLADSPLSVDDQLAGLVEFVDFEDSVRVEPEEVVARPQNLRVNLSLQIDDAAQVHCILSPDQSSYVDIEGGGDLMLTYSPDKDLQLNGRYTVNSGIIKYTMMVIPLKEFNIKSGSYVEFRGPLLNPALNMTATERLRTTVTENGQPRSVNFDVGMGITQTLENLGLEFTLEAPEDMGIQSDLSTMSAEQRGRVAVTMLATGMYITDSGTASGGGFTGQNALNALLQSQIANIAGKALKSVDLSVGLEQGTSASGSTTTDYSFRFAKRFWGNRISVIVGGKVSTGQDAVNTGESIIDNVSIEYRLDKSATRYVNLFYDKNYESLLDGEVTEMGGGLVLRKKTNRLGELFMFRNKKTLSPTPPSKGEE